MIFQDQSYLSLQNMQSSQSNQVVLTLQGNFLKNIQEAAIRKKEILFQDYVIEDFINKGSYAQVYAARHRQLGTKFALKIIQLGKLKKKEMQLIDQEEKLLKKCESPFVVKCQRCYKNEFWKVFVLEYCKGGTLKDYLQENDECIDQNEAVGIIKQICLGVYALYQQRIIHRDLKLENIIRTNGIIKIIDLGLAKLIPDRDRIAAQSNCGTEYTKAPEVKKWLPYGVKADIYSIGVIFGCLIVKNLAFFQRTPYNILNSECKNKNGQPLNPNIVRLIERMTMEDQDKRIGWSELLGNPLFMAQKHITQSNIEKLIEEEFSIIKTRSAIVIQQFQESVAQFREQKQFNKIIESSEQYQIDSLIQFPNQRKNDLKQQNEFPMLQQKQQENKNQYKKEEKKIEEQLIHGQCTDIIGQHIRKKQARMSYVPMPKDIESCEFRSMKRLSETIKPDFKKEQIYTVRMDKQIMFVPITEQSLTEMESKRLLAKKAQFIMKVLVLSLQSKQYKILNLSSTTHLKLMLLLCHRASFDLSEINLYFFMYAADEELVKKTSKLYKISREKHEKYLQLYKNQSSSSIFTSIFRKGQKQLERDILLGQENKNYLREEQINLTQSIIEKIVQDIYVLSVKRQLQAYKKIMNLRCGTQAFETSVKLIIQKY